METSAGRSVGKPALTAQCARLLQLRELCLYSAPIAEHSFIPVFVNVCELFLLLSRTLAYFGVFLFSESPDVPFPSASSSKTKIVKIL